MENPFITALEAILDRKYIITNPSKTLRYRKGYRSGRGDALAVVKPGNLTELWQVLKTAVKFDKIIIMQASNTSLTEGSIPAGGYDREVIIVSTTRMDHLQLINQGSQVLAFPGTTLYSLENALKPLGREPHSVIGSSCLGASAIGGICNNSGGSLVKRGPAYTELSLFASIDENGELQLVNHLGIDLGDTPEQIVANLDAGNFDPNAVPESPKHGHNHTYQTRVREIDADSPARYNADPNQLYESSGSAGKVAVFAVRLDTFPKEQNEKVFYIGTNTPRVLELIRRKALSEFKNLPVAGEYMHREIYDIAKKYGKDSFIVINKLGTDRLPYLFGLKANAERILDKMKIFKPYLPDRVLQKLSYLFPNHLPKRMEEFREKYEHHLMLKMSGAGSAEAEAYLNGTF